MKVQLWLGQLDAPAYTKSTAHRLFNRAAENIGFLPAPASERRGRTKLLPKHSEAISAFLKDNAEATLEEIKAYLAARFQEVADITLSALSKHMRSPFPDTQFAGSH